jgi:hypothetical protein
MINIVADSRLDAHAPTNPGPLGGIFANPMPKAFPKIVTCRQINTNASRLDAEVGAHPLDDRPRPALLGPSLEL